jgi:ABC-type transport system substrate-binding protein
VSSTAGQRPPGQNRVSTAVRDRAVTGLLVAVLAVAGFVIALPRVVAPPGSNSGAPSEAPSATPVAPAVYREGVVGKPTSVTPVTARTRADRELVGLIFSGLVKLGPGNTIVPDLASSWKVDRSGQTWTVSIRPDAVWQDGEPVTAQDVVYTISALKDPSAAGGLAATWADVTVEAIDAKTVRFTLGAPVGGFLAALTQPLLPSHLLSGVPMSELGSGEFASSPVGSGPFSLVQLDDTHAVLVRGGTALAAGGAPSASGGSDGAGPSGPGSNDASSAPVSSSDAPAAPSPDPSSAGAVASASPDAVLAVASPSAKPKATAKPAATASARPTSAPTPTVTPAPTAVADPSGRPIERIEITFYDTEDALAAAFAAGQIDGAAGLSPATTATLGASAGATVLDYPTTTLSAVLLNLRQSHPELQNPDVRKALLAAIDRKAIAGTALGGLARPADALIPPESWAYDATKVAPVAHDPALSAKLLKGAGWTKTGGKWRTPKGKAPYTIELLTVPSDVNPRLAAVADAVGQAWTALGITTTVKAIPVADIAARLKSGDFAAAVLDIGSGLEPDLYPLLDSSQVRANGSNRSGYQDPALDRLLEAARMYGPNANRKAAWSALLAGLSQRTPVLPIVWADEKAVVRGLTGATETLISHPGDRYWDVLAWRLAASR